MARGVPGADAGIENAVARASNGVRKEAGSRTRTDRVSSEPPNLGDPNARSRQVRTMPDGQERALVEIYLRHVAAEMTGVLADALTDMSDATADVAVQRLMYSWRSEEDVTKVRLG